MKTLIKNFSLILMAVLFVHAAKAQTAPAKETAPKPPVTASQYLLYGWNDVGRKLIAMAEDFPEDKYDFKPVPEQRSFAEQILHAAGSNYFVINVAKGDKSLAVEPKRSDYKTKAAVVAYLKQSVADGTALIKSKGDGGLGDLEFDPYAQQQVRFADEMWGYVEHAGEHYGQLVVYYRVAGLVPPESRPKK